MAKTKDNPRPPAGLGTAGRAYWRAVVGEWELSVDELELLKLRCSLLDNLAAYDAAIERDGLVVAGAEGQPRPHPLVAQRRADQRLFAQLGSQLGLVDSTGQTVKSGRQARSQAGHRARWGTKPAPTDDLAVRRASAS